MPADASMLWQVQYATFQKETNNQRRARSKFTYHPLHLFIKRY